MPEPLPATEPRSFRWNWRRVLIALLALFAVAVFWMRANSTSEGAFQALGAQVTAVQPRRPAFVPAFLWEVAIPRDILTVNYQSAPLPSGLLRRIGRLRSVRRIDLSRTDLDDAGLAKLGGLTSLEDLILDGTQITDEGLKSLSRLKSLRRLSVLRTAVTGAGLAEFERLAGRTGFRATATLAALRDLLPANEWVLRTPHHGGPIRKLAIEPRAGGPAHPGAAQHVLSREAVMWLRDVGDLDELVLSRIATDAIPLLDDMTNLQSLTLTADDSQMVALGRLRGLEQLHIVGGEITDAELHRLAPLPLRRLTINPSRIEGPGLGPILAMPSLETLEIRFDPVPKRRTLPESADPEWRARCDRLRAVLAEASPSRNLIRLALVGAPLDDAGCGALARFASVRHLDLNYCRSVTNQAGPALRQVPLETLNLSQTSVSPELLTALGRFPSLRQLTMGIGQVYSESGAERDAFRTANPECQVDEWIPPTIPPSQKWVTTK